MNKVLINYCYSWYRTNETNKCIESKYALTAEATADQHERADRRASERVRIELSDNTKGKFPLNYQTILSALAH